MSIDSFKLIGWVFVPLAVIFAAGITGPMVRRIHRGSPTLTARLAAPVLFGTLAAACFLGAGEMALVATALLGTAQIIAMKLRRDASASQGVEKP